MSATDATARERLDADLTLLFRLFWFALIPLLAVVLLGHVVSSQITAHLRTDVVDDEMFGYFGWRIAHGATVYLDVWDNKPPGIYWINALGFLIGGDSYAGVIALCLAAVCVTVVSFYVVCASLFHREVAVLGTILAGLFVTHGFFQGATNRTETFLIAFEVTAVALYMRGFSRDRWWKWFLAGVMCGCAFLFKQVGLVAWGAMGLHTIVLVITRQMAAGVGVRRCFLLLGGAAMSIGAAVGTLAYQGALAEAYWAVFTFNRAYFQAEASSWFINYANWILLKDHMIVLRLPLLMAVAACIHGFLCWLRPAARPAEINERIEAVRPVCPRSLLLFFIWFSVALYGAVVSPHAFRHYILPSIPPLLFMCAHLLNVLLAEAGLLRQLQQKAWTTFAFVVMAFFSWDAVYWQFTEVSKVYNERFDAAETPQGSSAPRSPALISALVGLWNGQSIRPAKWDDIGDAVARITDADDRIQCWGYQPGVYLQARRINASRFSTTEKLGQVKGFASRIEDELAETLQADPPVVFVISATDYTWLVKGLSPTGETEEVGVLGPWLEGNYERVDEVHNQYILKLKNRRE